MSNEPPQGVTWRDYTDARLEALRARIEQESMAIRNATQLANEAMDKRLDAMNEFRGSLNDLANRAATRDQLDSLREKVIDVKVQVAAIAAIMSALVSFLMRFFIK